MKLENINKIISMLDNLSVHTDYEYEIMAYRLIMIRKSKSRKNIIKGLNEILSSVYNMYLAEDYYFNFKDEIEHLLKRNMRKHTTDLRDNTKNLVAAFLRHMYVYNNIHKTDIINKRKKINNLVAAATNILMIKYLVIEGCNIG